MNIKFLVGSSFLIAFLFHVAFINLTTFIFPIDAESPKPKFFFLGPILTQKEVTLTSTKETAVDLKTSEKEIVNAADDFHGEFKDGADPGQNPFSIRSINKPLAPQTEDTQEKVVIKSTFEIESKNNEAGQKKMKPEPDPPLEIEPYRPLQFRAPGPVNSNSRP